jgi:3-oxoacyl-[acyl-carrier-protein] synthase II
VTQARAIKLALEDAELSPSDIGYVNAHGTATELGDITECEALKSVFGETSVPISTIKNYTGHTLGACGAIEAAMTIEMLRNGWYAPNLNLDEVDPRIEGLDFIRGSGRVIDTEFAMSNNFAFGGVNTSLILRRA